MALAQRGTDSEYRLDVAPVESGQHSKPLGYLQTLLQYRRIQVT